VTIQPSPDSLMDILDTVARFFFPRLLFVTDLKQTITKARLKKGIDPVYGKHSG
jgi:hypothetical protein